MGGQGVGKVEAGVVEGGGGWWWVGGGGWRGDDGREGSEPAGRRWRMRRRGFVAQSPPLLHPPPAPRTHAQHTHRRRVATGVGGWGRYVAPKTHARGAKEKGERKPTSCQHARVRPRRGLHSCVTPHSRVSECQQQALEAAVGSSKEWRARSRPHHAKLRPPHSLTPLVSTQPLLTWRRRRHRHRGQQGHGRHGEASHGLMCLMKRRTRGFRRERGEKKKSFRCVPVAARFFLLLRFAPCLPPSHLADRQAGDLRPGSPTTLAPSFPQTPASPLFCLVLPQPPPRHTRAARPLAVSQLPSSPPPRSRCNQPSSKVRPLSLRHLKGRPCTCFVWVWSESGRTASAPHGQRFSVEVPCAKVLSEPLSCIAFCFGSHAHTAPSPALPRPEVTHTAPLFARLVQLAGVEGGSACSHASHSSSRARVHVCVQWGAPPPPHSALPPIFLSRKE